MSLKQLKVGESWICSNYLFVKFRITYNNMTRAVKNSKHAIANLNPLCLWRCGGAAGGGRTSRHFSNFSVWKSKSAALLSSFSCYIRWDDVLRTILLGYLSSNVLDRVRKSFIARGYVPVDSCFRLTFGRTTPPVSVLKVELCVQSSFSVHWIIISDFSVTEYDIEIHIVSFVYFAFFTVYCSI